MNETVMHGQGISWGISAITVPCREVSKMMMMTKKDKTVINKHHHYTSKRNERDMTSTCGNNKDINQVTQVMTTRLIVTVVRFPHRHYHHTPIRNERDNRSFNKYKGITMVTGN